MDIATVKKIAVVTAPAMPPLGMAAYYATQGRPGVVAMWVALAAIYWSFFVPGLWSGILSGVRNLAAWSRPHAGRTVGYILSATKAGKDASWANFRANPWAWAGVTALAVAVWQFWKAYLGASWGMIHPGLFWLMVAGWCFTTHLAEGWDKVYTFITTHPVGLWLAVSIVALVVTIGHLFVVHNIWKCWGFVGLFVLSTLLACITLAKGWKATGRSTWNGAKWFFRSWAAAFFTLSMLCVLGALTIVGRGYGVSPTPLLWNLVGGFFLFLIAGLWAKHRGMKP